MKKEELRKEMQDFMEKQDSTLPKVKEKKPKIYLKL
mgnify:CR=1 FL=1